LWKLVELKCNVFVENKLFLNFRLLLKVNLSVSVFELPLEVEVSKEALRTIEMFGAYFALIVRCGFVMLIKAVVANAVTLLTWWQVWLHHQVLAHWAFVLLLNFNIEILLSVSLSGMAWR
jgi:hypothetical protein